MLTTIAIVLLIAWILGVVGVYTIGWYVHLFLAAAIILFVVRVIRGEVPLR